MTHVSLLNPVYDIHLKLSRSHSHGHEEEEPVNVHFEDPELEQVQAILRQYKLKLFLTLYTFFSEKFYEMGRRKRQKESWIDSSEEYMSKAEIVLLELYRIVQKRGSENDLVVRETFLKKYQEIN